MDNLWFYLNLIAMEVFEGQGFCLQQDHTLSVWMTDVSTQKCSVGSTLTEQQQ